jgi:16S rRNA C967 or C1407 C5-methylase (RsmB/RsmF family)
MNDTSVEMDFLGKTSLDAEGKGFMLQTQNPPAEGLAQMNMRTVQGPMGQQQEQIPVEGEEEESTEESLKEHLAALFANANLSENFVENEKSNEIATRINEAYKAQYTNALTETVNGLTEKIDDYLTYVVEEWINENKLQIERGIKVELAENFIFGLKKLFESNFIDVPNEKYDVLDELYTKIEQQEDQLNNSMNENIDLRKKLLESAAVSVFAQETRGLAQTQVEKLANLAEGIEYDDVEQFRGKIQILKESYFGNGNVQPQSAQAAMPRFAPKVDILDTSSEPEMISEGMDIYRRAISRHIKK